MRTLHHSRRHARRVGFTLIEILAVVLIMGMMLAYFVPNLGVTRNNALRQQALSLASYLELARQQAVLTGKPHRVYFDLEYRSYHLEWYVNENESQGLPANQQPEFDLRGQGPLPLSPPSDELLDYYRVSSIFGRDRYLQEFLFFEGIDTPEGWLESGEVVVVFQRDGSTDPAEIVIAHEEGGAIYLELQPLLGRVRVYYDDEV